MSLEVFDKDGNSKELLEKSDIKFLESRFLMYEPHVEFGLTDPIEGFKKIYDRIPANKHPSFVFLNCGAQYIAITQKTSNLYGSATILGYAISSAKYIRIADGTWYQ